MFLVDGVPRRSIAVETTQGVDWQPNTWHRVKVERELESGSIEVWFDGERLMRAVDQAHGWGYIGLGSFDDAGRFDDVLIRAPGSRSPRTPFAFPD